MPTKAPSAAHTRWGEFVILGMAGALGAGLWFGARGVPPNRPGAVVDMAITVVAADSKDLSCAFPEQIGPAHCEFKQPDDPWDSGLAAVADKVLVPYSLTNGAQAIVAGVFTQPDVAARAARDMALPRARQKRFIAECRVRLLEHRSAMSVRFGRAAGWGRFDQAWVGIAESCTTRD